MCLVSGQYRPGKKSGEALSFEIIKSYEHNLDSEARRGPEVVIATRNLVLPWLPAFGIDMMLRTIRMGLLLLGFVMGSFSALGRSKLLPRLTSYCLAPVISSRASISALAVRRSQARARQEMARV